MELCKGKTKAGGECRMRPPAGRDFCVNHGGKATPRPARSESPAKTHGKAPAAAQEKRAAPRRSSTAGVVAGVACGALFAAGLVVLALRLAGKAGIGAAVARATAGLRVVDAPAEAVS